METIFASPLLLVTFPVLVVIEPSAAAPAITFGSLFALAAAIAWASARERDWRLHQLAAVLVMIGTSAWSARALSPERLLAALGVYTALSLFFLAVSLFSLDGSGSPPLGVLATIGFRDAEQEVIEGDQLIFYTDGITEAMNPFREQFGEARLLAAIKRYGHLTASEFTEALDREIHEFTLGAPQNDDITLVAIRERVEPEERLEQTRR